MNNDDIDSPIHIHDLPLLQLRPLGITLIVILKLLSPNEVLNFNQVSEKISLDKTFEAKDICEKDLLECIADLNKWGSRFNTKEKLANIPNLLSTIPKNELNSWLVGLISSDLSWIDEETKLEIVRFTSLRISENCGRTAQPEIIRKITIPGLESLGYECIKLKEPSLTSDNLGLKTWGSSLVLSNKLVSSPQYLQSPILELGSGTGLVGMICKLLGHDIMVTDLEQIVPNLKDNFDLNNLSDVQVDELDWSNPKSFIDKHGNLKFKTIILSDPIYSSSHPPWIINMINMFLDENSKVLLQIPIRKNFDSERALLWRLLDENGYHTTEESYEMGYDDFGENQFCFKKIERNRPIESLS